MSFSIGLLTRLTIQPGPNQSQNFPAGKVDSYCSGPSRRFLRGGHSCWPDLPLGGETPFSFRVRYLLIYFRLQTASGILYNSWDAHYRQVNVLRFTTDGAALISGSDDSGVNVWSVSRSIWPHASLFQPTHMFRLDYWMKRRKMNL